MEPKKIAEFLKAEGQPEFRIQQVLKALMDGLPSYEEITTLPVSLRSRLGQAVPLLSFKVDQVRSSPDGSAHKARLHLGDGQAIETVLMAPKPGLWSVCVSSQVGCALKCDFCATGLMGFKRNLTVEEITDQVLWWRQFLRSQGRVQRINNVVYMGMGEPMLNFDSVKTSIGRLCDPGLFAMAHRSIAVSTAGIAPGIVRFAKECPQVHLALSLHAANNMLRTRLVPINKSYPLEKLVESLKRYFAANNRKVFLEYVLLDRENDQPRHAEELARFIQRVGPAHLLHVNLIVFNPTNTGYRPSSRAVAAQFKNTLLNRGLHATIRKNLGQEISGACGQLIVGK